MLNSRKRRSATSIYSFMTWPIFTLQLSLSIIYFYKVQFIPVLRTLEGITLHTSRSIEWQNKVTLIQMSTLVRVGTSSGWGRDGSLRSNSIKDYPNGPTRLENWLIWLFVRIKICFTVIALQTHLDSPKMFCRYSLTQIESVSFIPK